MRFNILYTFLKRQIYTPSIKAKCRVYMAKDIRCYHKQYQEVVQQLIGASWDPTVQKIAYDNLLIKKFFKATIAIIILLVTLFAFL